jgi:hypothetical protein
LDTGIAIKIGEKPQQSWVYNPRRTQWCLRFEHLAAYQTQPANNYRAELWVLLKDNALVILREDEIFITK